MKSFKQGLVVAMTATMLVIATPGIASANAVPSSRALSLVTINHQALAQAAATLDVKAKAIRDAKTQAARDRAYADAGNTLASIRSQFTGAAANSLSVTTASFNSNYKQKKYASAATVLNKIAQGLDRASRAQTKAELDAVRFN